MALPLQVKDAMKWSRPFQFRPFAVDVSGALGSAAKAAVDQFAREPTSQCATMPTSAE